VLAPSPSRGGFAPEALLERARDVVVSRAFQLFVGRPDAEGESGLDLGGEPEGSEGDPPEAAERAHRDELAGLRAAYEGRLAELEAGARIELAREVRARLLDLATRPKAAPAEAAHEAPR
jgi:hypothetical protein